MLRAVGDRSVAAEGVWRRGRLIGLVVQAVLVQAEAVQTAVCRQAYRDEGRIGNDGCGAKGGWGSERWWVMEEELVESERRMGSGERVGRCG